MDAADSTMVTPPLVVSEWFDTETAITLDDLCGHVPAIEAFQMLCPGCVSHGLPQAQRIASVFGSDITVRGCTPCSNTTTRCARCRHAPLSAAGTISPSARRSPD